MTPGRLATLIAQSVLLVALVATNAMAEHGEGQNSENPIDQPTVSAEYVEEVLAKEHSINLAHTKVEGDLQLHASEIERFSAQDTVFEGDLDVDPCVEQRSGRCEGDVGESVFEFTTSELLGRVDFTDLDWPPDAYFGKLWFINCEFKQETDFRSISSPEVNLLDSVFEEDVAFTSATVSGTIALSGVHFKGAADFTGARFGYIRTYRLQANEPIVIRWGQFPESWVEQEKKDFSRDRLTK